MTGIELTFQIHRDADRVKVSYHQDGRLLADPRGMPAPTASGPFPALLSGLIGLLQEGDWRALDDHLSGDKLAQLGHALFAVLFPQREQVSAIIKAACRETTDTVLAPESRTINARIVATDRVLAALPWRLTRSGNVRLTSSLGQWTFEVARSVAGEGIITFNSPPRVLVIAPEAGEPELPVDDHIDRLQGRLTKYDDRYREDPFWVVARTEAGIREACNHDPDVIYYFGHGRYVKGAPCAQLDDGFYPFAELIEYCDTTPQIVYLNGCWSGGSGWHQTGPALTARVPLVLTHPTTACAGPAGEQALEWWDAVIGQGAHPIAVLAASANARRSLASEYSMLAAYTRFKRWTPGRALERRTAPIHATLDRLPQRHPTVAEFERVTRIGRRVCVLVGSGTPENRPERLADLLQEHLMKTKRSSWQMRFTQVGTDQHPWHVEGPEAAFRRALGISSYGPDLVECVRQGLRGLRGRKLRILVLKWQATLTALTGVEGIEALLEFHRELASKPLSPDHRVVSIVTLITDKSDGLTAMIQDYEADHGADGTGRYKALKPLGVVPRDELIDHLRDHTTAPPHMAPQLADLLLARTKGVYDPLVKQIEAAAVENWRSLLKSTKKKRSYDIV